MEAAGTIRLQIELRHDAGCVGFTCTAPAVRSPKFPDGAFGSARGTLAALAALLWLLDDLQHEPAGVFRDGMLPLWIDEQGRWIEGGGGPQIAKPTAPHPPGPRTGKFDAVEKAECAERELAMRNRVYGRSGELTLQNKRELELMAEIAADYRMMAAAQSNDMFAAGG